MAVIGVPLWCGNSKCTVNAVDVGCDTPGVFGVFGETDAIIKGTEKKKG